MLNLPLPPPSQNDQVETSAVVPKGEDDEAESIPAALSESAQLVVGLGVGGSVATPNTDGSIYLTVPAEGNLNGQSITLTTSTAVDFNQTLSSSTGDLYVVSAGENSVTLAFNLMAGGYDLNSSAYQITLNTTDHITWTGVFPNAYTFPISTLGYALNSTTAGLVSGAMTSQDGSLTSARMNLAYSQDAAGALLVGYEDGVQLATVAYVYGDGGRYEMSLPLGAPLYNVTPALAAGQSLTWYNDESFSSAVDFAAQMVTGDTTIYGQVTSESTDSSFADQLDKHDAVLYIQDADDWTTFTQRSGDVAASQRVELQTDVDGDGASLQALNFAGSFNGNGHTISNYRFTANGENAGLFASLGGGSVVANLNLTGITVSSATYSGPLAGSISGGEGHNVLIQNVQVRDCSVTGRSAGGLAGFAIWGEIRYCSVADGTTITGIVNGGGLVGISYAQIHDCYANVTPTALLTRGGIVGRNLEGGAVKYCWCTYRSVYGSQDSTSSSENNVVSVSARTQASAFTGAGFDKTVWSIGGGTSTTFTGEVYYKGFEA